MTYNTVLFDLDGTLTNTSKDLQNITNITLRELGYPERSLSEVCAFVGNGVKKLIEHALPEGVTLTDAIYTQMKANYLKYQNTYTAPYEGIPEMLRGLKNRGFKLGVVSNKMDSAAQVVVETYFPGVFDFITGQRDELRPKPYPDLTDLACRTLGVTPDTCIYIGDSETDVETGLNAHMLTLSATWGFRDRETLSFHGALHFVDCPQDILDYIDILA